MNLLLINIFINLKIELIVNCKIKVKLTPSKRLIYIDTYIYRLTHKVY